MSTVPPNEAEHDPQTSDAPERAADGPTESPAVASGASASPDPSLDPSPDPSADDGAPTTLGPVVPAEPSAPPAPMFARSEWLPTSFAGRLLAVVGLLALGAYCFATMKLRMAGMFDQWAADGDQAQAVWHYWRYHIPGLFPPGDFLTDYAFAMHAPPVWWVMMASFSKFMEPVLAAKIWNLVAYALGIVAIVGAVGKRTNIFIGIAAGFLLARNVDYSAIIAGGYARSFGPFLTLLFLGVFMAGRHKLALVVLVLQAALYPSVVIPCGVAYGLYTVIAGPMPKRIRRMAGMFIAGLLIIAFGKSQDLVSHDWWGPLVTYEEASSMEVWRAGGRVAETPMRPLSVEVPRHTSRAFRQVGPALSTDLTAAVRRHLPSIPIACFVLVAGAWGIVAWRRRKQGESVIDPIPWQLPLLILTSFMAYFLARALFFKLYIPYRPLQHVVPYVTYAAIPLFLWALFVNLLPRRRALATVLTVVFTVAPQFAIFGNGYDKGPRSYVSYSWNRTLYPVLRKLPLNALVAGDFTNTSSAPLFGHVLVYVNKNLAHPFRLGFWAEAERRIMGTYEALYATNYDDVLAFAKAEKIDYLIWQKSIHQKPDRRLFNPVRRPLNNTFRVNKARGFVLGKRQPRSAVVFEDRDTVLLDVAKLSTWYEAEKAKKAADPAAPDLEDGDQDAPGGKDSKNTDDAVDDDDDAGDDGDKGDPADEDADD